MVTLPKGNSRYSSAKKSRETNLGEKLGVLIRSQVRAILETQDYLRLTGQCLVTSKFTCLTDTGSEVSQSWSTGFLDLSGRQDISDQASKTPRKCGSLMK